VSSADAGSAGWVPASKMITPDGLLRSEHDPLAAQRTVRHHRLSRRTPNTVSPFDENEVCLGCLYLAPVQSHSQIRPTAHRRSAIVIVHDIELFQLDDVVWTVRSVPPAFVSRVVGENRIAVPDESYRRVNLRQHGSASQNPDFPNTGSKAKNTSGTPYPTQQSVKMKVVALRDGCFFRAVFEHIRLSEATLLQGSQQAALHEVVWS